METRHIRFYISELIAALEAYGKLRRPSISEALTYYYNWAYARGWRIISVLGHGGRQRIWTGAGDRSTQLEIQELDYAYEVVMAGEDTDGTCDFIEAFPVVVAVRDIVEELEARGWVIDADRDGYQKEDGYLYIAGGQIAKLPLERVFDWDSPEGVAEACDLLESNAVRMGI